MIDAKRKKQLTQLTEDLHIKIFDYELLNEALIHSSYGKEMNTADNERLEFLGDVVLNFNISDYLYRHYPSLPESKLSRIRAAITNKTALASYAKEINLQDYILVGKTHSQGEQLPDSIIANAFEALIAAIYLLNGLDEVTNLLRRLNFYLHIEELVNGERALGDYKTKLQEIIQKTQKSLPVYKLTKVNGPPHKPNFHVCVMVNGEVLGYGEGSRKRDAEQQAAYNAIERLKNATRGS